MASEDYLPLFRKARREHLGNIARVSAEIIKLYREAAADLAARAAASRKGSLTERWASEYAESLKKRTAELNAGLYEVTLQGLKRSAGLPRMVGGGRHYAGCSRAVFPRRICHNAGQCACRHHRGRFLQ